MDTIIIKNGIIATLGSNSRVLYGHSILVEGSKIIKIAPNNEFNGKYSKVIDATGKLVLPGFICSHMHFYSTFARGLGKAKASKNFVEVLENLWWRLDKKLTADDNYYSALLPLIDGIKRGTTTFIDHHASPFSIRGSLGLIAKAVKKTGLRASLCYELSDRDGEKVAQEGLEENVEFIKRCNSEKDPQLKALLGLHASFTISDKTLEKAAQNGNDLKVGFHVHTAEAKSDEEYNEKNFNLRVVERFKKFGLLRPETILAHCVHINNKEMELVKEADAVVVHNPQSNMNNAVGVMDLLKLKSMGILVGLGTDAMTVNMLEELRCCLWLHHLAQNNPSCAFMETAETLLLNNSLIAERFWPGLGLGVLNEGNEADIILFDYHSPTPLSSDNLYGHMIFGVSQSFADTTIVAGKVLMENKKLLIDIDEKEIAAKATELSSRLWERF